MVKESSSDKSGQVDSLLDRQQISNSSRLFIQHRSELSASSTKATITLFQYREADRKAGRHEEQTDIPAEQTWTGTDAQSKQKILFL